VLLINTLNKKFIRLIDLHEAQLWVQNYAIRCCHFYILISIKASTLNNKPPEILNNVFLQRGMTNTCNVVIMS